MRGFSKTGGKAFILAIAAGLLTLSPHLGSRPTFAQGEPETWVVSPHGPSIFKGRKVILREEISEICGNILVTAKLNKEETKFESIAVKTKEAALSVPSEILDLMPMPATHSFRYSREVGCKYGRMYNGISVSFVFDVPPKVVNDPIYYFGGNPKSAVITIRGGKITSWKYEVEDTDGNQTWIKHEVP